MGATQATQPSRMAMAVTFSDGTFVTEDADYDMFAVQYEENMTFGQFLEKCRKETAKRKGIDPKCLLYRGDFYRAGRVESASIDTAVDHRLSRDEFEALTNPVDVDTRSSKFLKGLIFVIRFDIFDHGYHSNINCPHLSANDRQELQKIYSTAAQNVFISKRCKTFGLVYNWHQFNAVNLKHLQEHNHWNDSSSREACQYGTECYSFVRIESGDNSNFMADKCHMLMYCHPPRKNRNIVDAPSTSKWNELMFAPLYDKLQPLEKIDNMDYRSMIALFKPSFLIRCLLGEIKGNEAEMKKDYGLKTYEEFKEQIEAKLNDTRHRRLGKPLHQCEMAAIMLYVKSCALNADFCAAQRSGNGAKWKIMDVFLYYGVYKLWLRERSVPQALYSGVSGVKVDMNNHQIPLGYATLAAFSETQTTSYFTTKNNDSFLLYPKTYISATWNRNVAEVFSGHSGILFEFVPELRNALICADISWISDIPDECEVLIARGVRHQDPETIDMNRSQYMGACVADDQKNGNDQIIKLKDVFFNGACFGDRYSSHEVIQKITSKKNRYGIPEQFWSDRCLAMCGPCRDNVFGYVLEKKPTGEFNQKRVVYHADGLRAGEFFFSGMF